MLQATSISIDGGRTIQAFLRAGLISERTITPIRNIISYERSFFRPVFGS